MPKKRPELIVLNLDETLWKIHLDVTVDPPFQFFLPGLIEDKYFRKIRAYPESEKVLKYLTDEGYKLAIASRTTMPSWAKQLMNMFGFDQYFKYVQIFPGCKVKHFGKLCEESRVHYRDMLFFDDELRNCREVGQLGVMCELVIGGITMKAVQEGIAKFQRERP